MKTLRTILVTLLVSSSVMAMAQGRHRPVVPTNTQALTNLQSDLQAAITSMEAALPIYDGDRVKSIHAAHEALGIVDRVILGAKATPRAKSTARDHVPSTSAKHKYTSQQISQSQSNMQQGLSSLQAAAGAITAASTNPPSKRAQKVNELIQKAITEATAALNIHSSLKA